MNNSQFVVLFHQVNYPLAVAMTRDLVRAGFTFSLLCEDDLQPGEILADRLRGESRPVVLMVSENFLKTAACVHQLLPALKARPSHTLQIIVLTEGNSEEGQAPTPTRLDRVGQILQYINYWQDRYLTLRKRQAASEPLKPEQEQELKWTRQIAFEIGNLIEFFRESSAYPWEAFTANHYELFFRKSGNISLHEDYRQGHPFAEDDRHLETTLHPTGASEEDGPEERLIREMLLEAGEEPATPQEDTPEKDLLSKLIAYKNGLESDPPTDQEDGASETGAAEDQDGGAEIIALPGRDAAGLRRLIERDPDNISARLELAQMLYTDDAHFNESTSLLEAVLHLDPRNAKAYYLLGQLAQRYREHKLAQRYFEKCLDADPEYGPAHFALANLLQRDPTLQDQTLFHLNQARKLLPEDGAIRAAYALALAAHGPRKKALKALHKALELDPDNPELQKTLKSLQPEAESTVVLTEAPEAPEVILQPVSPVREQPAVGQTQVKTILITGATSGIGRATARLLAAKGHRLILTGRREDRLSALQAELEQQWHATVFPMAFDIRQEAVTRQLIRALPQEWSHIDILINNAGLAKGLAPIHEGNIDHWDTMIDTNLKGLLYMTRAVAPGMVQRRSGQIINICSTAGKEVYPNGNVYCATKFGVDALTRGMRQDLVKYGIRVGQVSPGHVEETEFALNRFDGDRERARIYEDFNPLRSRDVAEAIWWMISQPAHVNIQDILLTGTQQAGSTIIERTGRIFDEGGDID